MQTSCLNSQVGDTHWQKYLTIDLTRSSSRQNRLRLASMSLSHQLQRLVQWAWTVKPDPSQTFGRRLAVQKSSGDIMSDMADDVVRWLSLPYMTNPGTGSMLLEISFLLSMSYMNTVTF